MQEEVEHRTVALAINTTEMSADVLKAAISKYLTYCKEKRIENVRAGPVKPCGKQSIKQLVGQNQGVSNMEISNLRFAVTGGHAIQALATPGKNIKISNCIIEDAAAAT